MAETITADLGPAVQAIREVLNDNAGSSRKIDRTRFETGLWDTLGVSEQSRRAQVTPRFEVSVTGTKPHPASPAAPCNKVMLITDFEVTVVRHLGLEHASNDVRRERLRSLAANDGLLIALALEYPGNLLTDSDGDATNLSSGCLTYEASALTRFELRTDAASIIETTHTFSGVYIASITIS